MYRDALTMFGRLTLDAFVHGPIEMGAQFMVVGGAVGAVVLITYYRAWGYLYREWLTSLDAKKIGLMYLMLAFVMLMRGGADALLMRGQQAVALGEGLGYLSPDHYAQIFSAHGVIMIFFVAMPLVFGLMNLVVPLQIGARDVAFPLLNSISFWLTVAGAMLINLSLVVGEFAATGWLAYPPLSGLEYSPGVGVDYYIWALQIAGVGTLLGGINFITTIVTMRAPGMSWMRVPIFTWTALGSSALILFAFPILTVTLALLSVDRLLGMHFFTTDMGGSAMMYVNLIWAWGHPEVYILILPAFGVFSEIVPVFARKRLFGYVSMVVATLAIVLLSFVVWVHHFFTMGAGANVNAFFGIMTMAIAIPTGVKVFNWLFTMFRGRIRFATPMLWFMGFIMTFTVGGMTGVLMSLPAADFQLHNSVFLVAHFHNMIIGGVLFGMFAGITYWFPKFAGFMLDERIGKVAFWLWMAGFILAFLPLYALGLMGMTRRLDVIDPTTGWHPLLLVAATGACVIALAVATQIVQIVVSYRNRAKLVAGNDPWNARTLEWATTSPPPEYNFARLPHAHGRDAFWLMKESSVTDGTPLEAIALPRPSPVGLMLGVISGALGFALIWHIWWLAIVALVAIVGVVVWRSFEREIECTVPKEKLA